jgi:hypothetical protein
MTGYSRAPRNVVAAIDDLEERRLVTRPALAGSGT